MVRATLLDQKKATRRTKGLEKINETPSNYYFQSLVLHASGRFTFVEVGNYNPKDCDVIEVKCPYGKPGDRLWVRESFDTTGCMGTVLYKANYTEEELREGKHVFKWKPSRYMPKSAARIWLEITNIRLERLWDITEEGAIEEGVYQYTDSNYKSLPYPSGWDNCFQDYLSKPRRKNELPVNAYTSAIASFASLWVSINDQQSWDKNPWVWVIEFKRVEGGKV